MNPSWATRGISVKVSTKDFESLSSGLNPESSANPLTIPMIVWYTYNEDIIMPTYQYECEECGYHFEEMQMITAKKLKTCPKCKKDSLTRLIGSGSGIIFKGTGFYETDYKRKS